MFKRAQCLLFYAQELEESSGVRTISFRGSTPRKKSTKESTSVAGGVKIHSLLATTFTDQHPEVITLFQQNDIHIVQNGDEGRVFKENTQLEVLEISLDERPGATVDPLSVSTDHLDTNFVLQIFSRTMITLDRPKWFATDVRPAVDDKNCKVFKRLLEVQFGLNKGLDKGSLLHLATSREQVVLVRVALDNGANIDDRTENGSTPLHLAVSRGALPLVELIIGMGAFMDCTNKHGWTPLHVACRHSNLMIVKFLLNNNANVHIKTNRGLTPLHEAAFIIEKKVKSKKDAADIVLLLLKAGAAVDVKDNADRSPLHLAHVPEILKILLKNGADANSLDSYGRPPIHKVAGWGSCASFKILLDYGARLDLSPNNKSVLEIVYDRCSTDPNVLMFLLEYCFVGPRFWWEIENQRILNKIDDCYWFTNKFRSTILSQHLVKMTVLHELTSKMADVHKIWRSKTGTMDDFQQECMNELVRIKATILAGTDLSLHDFLIRDDYLLTRLLINPATASSLNPAKLKKRFPLYGTILSYQVRKGEHRKGLQEKGIRNLNRLCPCFKQLPDEIKEEIISHLRIADIVNLCRISFPTRLSKSVAHCQI